MLTVVNSALQATTTLPAAQGSAVVELGAGQRDSLVRLARASTTSERVVTRSVVVLLSASGWSNARIALSLGISRRTVALWKARFAGRGPQALLVDAPGRGRKRGRDGQTVARIVAMTGQYPPEGRRWTVRTLARAVGVSHATVQRVWREHAINPADSYARSV